MGLLKNLNNLMAKKPKLSTKEFLAKGIVAVLQYNAHCRECPYELKKCCESMNGVLSAELDKEKAEIRVKGVFDEEKLKKYIRRKVNKVVTILKVEKVAEEEAAPDDTVQEDEEEIRTEERGETSHG